VLMILNVVLATVKHALPMVPDVVFVVAEALLLIIRAVMAVPFGHAIHALREEYGDSMITVKEARELEKRTDELAAGLAQVQQNLQQQFARELAQLAQNLLMQLAQQERSLQHGIDESSSMSGQNVQQLARELASMRENVQQLAGELALVPALQAHLQELDSVYHEEMHRIHTALDAHRQRDGRPVLRVVSPLSSRTGEISTSQRDKFDARAFVFTHLQANPELKLAELAQLAREHGQELSQSSISRYRKQFFASPASALAHEFASSESSTMQAFLALASGESENLTSDKRHVVGE